MTGGSDDFRATLDSIAIDDETIEMATANQVQRGNTVILRAEFNSVKHFGDGLLHLRIAAHQETV